MGHDDRQRLLRIWHKKKKKILVCIVMCSFPKALFSYAEDLKTSEAKNPPYNDFDKFLESRTCALEECKFPNLSSKEANKPAHKINNSTTSNQYCGLYSV